MAVRPVPEGYSSITPYLIITGAAEAIDFYKRVFGATEVMRFGGPDGKVGHAELRIGNSTITATAAGVTGETHLAKEDTLACPAMQ